MRKSGAQELWDMNSKEAKPLGLSTGAVFYRAISTRLDEFGYHGEWMKNRKK